jgi:hypothetical protein
MDTVLKPERFRVSCAFGGGRQEINQVPHSPVSIYVEWRIIPLIKRFANIHFVVICLLAIIANDKNYHLQSALSLIIISLQF